MLLAHVDLAGDDAVRPLGEVTRAAVLGDCTLVCAWSPEVGGGLGDMEATRPLRRRGGAVQGCGAGGGLHAGVRMEPRGAGGGPETWEPSPRYGAGLQCMEGGTAR